MSAKQRLKDAMSNELKYFKVLLPKGVGPQQTADMTTAWIQGLTAAFIILQDADSDDYDAYVFDPLMLGHALLEMNEKIQGDIKQGPAIILPFNR